MEIFLNSMKRENCSFQAGTNKGSVVENGWSTEVTGPKNQNTPTALIYWKNLRSPTILQDNLQSEFLLSKEWSMACMSHSFQMEGYSNPLYLWTGWKVVP